jgi:CDP-paratose 2-epimerase
MKRHNGRHLSRRNNRPRADRVTRIGMLEWFRIGEHDRVDRVLDDLETLGVNSLRTGISWADWHTPEGESWYAWLLPQLSRRVEVLPCFVYTPPSWGVAPSSTAPPRDLRAYANFIDHMIRRFGKHFE